MFLSHFALPQLLFADDGNLEKYFSIVEAVPEKSALHLALGLLGHAHYSFVHFPIAFAPLLLLMEFSFTTFFSSVQGRRVRGFLWSLTSGAIFFAIASGLARSRLFAADAPEQSQITLHLSIGIAAFAACCLEIFVLRRSAFVAQKRIQRGIALLLLVLVSAAGYVGGEIAFGPWFPQ